MTVNWGDFPNIWTIKNVPNHQPGNVVKHWQESHRYPTLADNLIPQTITYSNMVSGGRLPMSPIFGHNFRFLTFCEYVYIIIYIYYIIYI